MFLWFGLFQLNIRLVQITIGARSVLKENRVWPYVLPFPLEVKKRKLIWAILQSRVGMSILTRMKLDERTFQHDLIVQLPYSNKSIIKYLKQMANAGILEHGVEGFKEKGKTVWMKWYTPSSLGKWFILFLTPPEEIRPELAKRTIEELFRVYSSSIVEVCEKYGLNIDSFQQVFDEHYLRAATAKAEKIKPKVVVYGSAALDIYGNLETLPKAEETVYVEEVGRYAGGMGANVAVALARLGVPVSFVGRIGSDFVGRVLLDGLRKNGVGISNVNVTSQRSLRTLIFRDKKQTRWLFALGSPDHAMSITSPSEIDWKLLDQCKIVYIGEVFTEIAATIASYAKSKDKLVVYRPGVPYMCLGVEKLGDILKHTNMFILNKVGWDVLQNFSKNSVKTPADLIKFGPTEVIVTKGAEGCDVYTKRGHFAMMVPLGLRDKFEVVDPTGAGDSFSAGLIKGLLGGWTLKKAVAFGQVAACITCSRIGASSAFPTLEEVEAVKT
jgi:sugar/nucleoside kinase (ribokinase family)